MNNDIINQFQSRGITAPPSIELDGKLKRWNDGTDDKSRKSGWMIGHNNVTSEGANFYVIVGGSWRSAQSFTWHSNGVNFDKHDKKRIKEQIEKSQKIYEQEKEKVQIEVAKNCQLEWDSYSANYCDNQYFKIKRITPGDYGLRFSQGIGGVRIKVPMRDTDDVLWGIQSIGEDGSKFFTKGQRVEGTFHTLGACVKEATEVYICEGFATGAAIYEAIQKTVVIAFNAQNLVMVAKKLFQKYPDKAYIVCGDDDKFTEINGVPKNAGRETAESASKACVGKLVFPTFEDEKTKPTDFNDLYCLEGLEKVKACFADVQPEAHFVRALGFNEGNYYVYSNVNLQVQVMSSQTLCSSSGLQRLQSKDYWESIYPGPRGSIRWSDAGNDVMQRCHAVGIFKPDNIRGTGAWMDQGRPVYHCGDKLFYNGAYHPLTGDLKTRFMYNFDATTSSMDCEPLTDKEASAFVDALECASWKRPESGSVMAAWMVLAPISGALDWRSHIWATGPTGSGKSWVLDHVCYKILKGYATFVQGKTTEAGMRQHQGNRSLPFIFDEFETNDENSGQRIRDVLELARQASSDTAAIVLKGSAGGDAVQYRPRFALMCSSVRINLIHEEDQNRFTIVEMTHNENNHRFAELEKWALDMPEDFGARLARRSFEALPTIIANSRVFQKTIGKKYSSRFGQQWGTIAAGIASLCRPGIKFSVEQAEEFIVKFFVEKGVFDQSAPNKDERDESKALDHLLHSLMEVVDFRGDRTRMQVLEVIRHVQAHSGDYSKELEREGIKVEGDYVFIINNFEPIRKRYSRTKWAGGYTKAILRLPKTQPSVSKWFGIQKKAYRCVGLFLPIESEQTNLKV
jgi:putative DNA primase/helicase